MVKQIHKVIKRNYVKRADVVKPTVVKEETADAETVEPIEKNKKNKKNAKMGNVTNEQLTILEGALDMTNTKVVKKDRGLIERTESSKIILTEDNRQVLTD